MLTVSTVGVVLPTRLLVGVFARSVETTKPALGILLLEGSAASSGCGPICADIPVPRPDLRLIGRWHPTAVFFLVSHLFPSPFSRPPSFNPRITSAASCKT